jgi:hypothetical protein
MKTTRALCGKNFMEKSQTNPFGLSLTLAIKYESAKQGAHLRKDTYLVGPKKGRPPVCKIADFDDEELKGTFYEQELQRVNKTDSDFYRVEEVLRSRMRNKRKEYFVMAGLPR